MVTTPVDFFSLPALGALYALGSGLTWAVTSLLVRTVSPPLSSVTASAIRALLGGGVLLLWVLLTGGIGRLTSMGETNFLMLVVSIVLAIAIGDVLFFESLRFIGLARAMTVSMIYPLMSAVMAAILLGEPLTARLGVGSLVTVLGLALIVRARSGAPPREERFALGLAAAIPAVVIYNVFARSIAGYRAGLGDAAAEVLRLVSRDVERAGAVPVERAPGEAPSGRRVRLADAGAGARGSS